MKGKETKFRTLKGGGGGCRLTLNTVHVALLAVLCGRSWTAQREVMKPYGYRKTSIVIPYKPASAINFVNIRISQDGIVFL